MAKNFGTLGKVFQQDHKSELEQIQKTAKKLGIELSPIKEINPNTLRDNPDNQKYFERESDEYFWRLEEDIQERGILVPLIAQRNGLLLSGHNRKEVALKIGLLKVPVQFVLVPLTPQQELQFLLKDNVLRRQLAPQQIVYLIGEIYKETLLEDQRGGDRKSHYQKSKRQSDSLMEANLPIHKKVADTFHVPESTAKRYTAKARKLAKGIQETKDPMKDINKYLKSIRRTATNHPNLIKHILTAMEETRDELLTQKIKGSV